MEATNKHESQIQRRQWNLDMIPYKIQILIKLGVKDASAGQFISRLIVM